MNLCTYVCVYVRTYVYVYIRIPIEQSDHCQIGHVRQLYDSRVNHCNGDGKARSLLIFETFFSQGIVDSHELPQKPTTKPPRKKETKDKLKNKAKQVDTVQLLRANTSI